MLYMFDLDGTLIESYLEEITCPRCNGKKTDPFKHEWGTGIACEQCRGKGTWVKLVDVGYDEVNWLPGRLNRLHEIADRGDKIAICTNQTGVHYGYQTQEQVETKLKRVLRDLNHPYACSTYACYEPGPFRKPAPGMLNQALQAHRVPAWASVFVGDMRTDEEAAARAGVPFCWSDIFFEGPRGLKGEPDIPAAGPIPDRFKTVQFIEGGSR